MDMSVYGNPAGKVTMFNDSASGSTSSKTVTLSGVIEKIGETSDAIAFTVRIPVFV